MRSDKDLVHNEAVLESAALWQPHNWSHKKIFFQGETWNCHYICSCIYNKLFKLSFLRMKYHSFTFYRNITLTKWPPPICLVRHPPASSCKWSGREQFLRSKISLLHHFFLSSSWPSSENGYIITRKLKCLLTESKTDNKTETAKIITDNNNVMEALFSQW